MKKVKKVIKKNTYHENCSKKEGVQKGLAVVTMLGGSEVAVVIMVVGHGTTIPWLLVWALGSFTLGVSKCVSKCMGGGGGGSVTATVLLHDVKMR